MESSKPDQSKEHSTDTLVKFVALIERQMGSKLDSLHRDGSEENVSTQFSKFLNYQGMGSNQTCAYTAQQQKDSRANQSYTS